MATEPAYVDFTLSDREPVVTVMREVARGHDGWLNIAPVFEVEELPEPPTLTTRIFGAKGPEIPFLSWVPGTAKRGDPGPTSLGLQHGAGAKAILRLRGLGIAVPDGWKVLADHGRRGIVLEVPDSTDPAVALDWLLRAALALTDLVLPEHWRGAVHRTGR